ncbi:MAG TPA: ABC transporter permease [Panacibacter sp.]|nr:ABC transporter permease [Panacibacter sp.]HNP46055.1 ABC transporter permease [Panacibacter sp.]
MYKNYLLIAWRNLRRNKVYAFINIAGLSLGLGCAMLIMLYVKDEVSYDRFLGNVNNIYRVVYKNTKPDGTLANVNGFSGYFQGPKFAASIPEIRGFVRYQSNNVDMKTGTEITSQEMFYTDTDFFATFSFPLLKGNPATALKEPNSVVLSEDMAMQQFGTTDALGKTMLFKKDDRFEPYVVTGVAKNCPQNSSIRFRVLMPMIVSKEDASNNENWFNFFMNTFVVLTPGADTAKVHAKMKQVYESDAEETIKMMAEKYNVNEKTTYFLQPFTDVHLSKELPAQNGLVGESNPVYSYILSAIAVFILLIACINFVNLTVARSVKRAREIGIRKVVGGDRRQLIIQFLGESFMLCFIAFVLAIGFVQLVLPLFNDLSNKALSLSYLFDAKLISAYIVLFLLTSLMAGFYPALVLSKYNPVQTLYSRFTIAGKNYLQKSLVVLQFALASFLISATLIIFYQFNFLTSQSLGYNDKNLVEVKKWGINRNEAAVMKSELLKDPSIQDVTFKNGGSWGTIARVNGEKEINFAYETVDDNYLPMLQIALAKGRNFSAAFPSDSTHSVLVNERFVKEAGWKDPVGQQVDFWYRPGEKYTVVGVVKDYHYESLNQEIGPELFTMKPGNDYGKALIKVKPGSETAALKQIEKVFKQLFPVSPYDYKFVDEENRNRYEAEAKWKQIMLFSAILTIFISCIGLFGLSVLSAEKRTKEIGIRKVLGASVQNVVAILSADFLKLVALALCISIPAAWLAADKWLQNYPYRISLNFWMFAIAAIAVVMIALITISFQSLRAAIANPVKSLRSE